jgi:hypothetical protein
MYDSNEFKKNVPTCCDTCALEHDCFLAITRCKGDCEHCAPCPYYVPISHSSPFKTAYELALTQRTTPYGDELGLRGELHSEASMKRVTRVTRVTGGK